MDYKKLSEKELYKMLSQEDKIIVSFFDSFPKINKSALKKLGVNYSDDMNLAGLDAIHAFNKIVNNNLVGLYERAKNIMSELEDINDLYEEYLSDTEYYAKELKHRDAIIKEANALKPTIAKLRNLLNPIVLSINQNNQAFAYYLLKKKYYLPVNPADIFPNLIENQSNFFEIINELELVPDKCDDEIRMLKILRRMTEHPEEETQLLAFYYKLKSVGFCDVNEKYYYAWQPYIHNKSNAKNMGYTFGQYLLHDAIMRYPEEIPLLLKFEDLDVNLKNESDLSSTFGAYYGVENPHPNNGNTPIMQLFRWADEIHMIKSLSNINCDTDYLKYKRPCDEPEECANIRTKYNIDLSNKYIDELVRRGAVLDYKNKNGESIVMTAIHHFHVHGVEVCESLLYPDILEDMYALDGRSTWSEFPTKICEILSNRFPEMKDSTGICYQEYLDNKSQVDAESTHTVYIEEEDGQLITKLADAINKYLSNLLILEVAYGKNSAEYNGYRHDVKNKLKNLKLKGEESEIYYDNLLPNIEFLKQHFSDVLELCQMIEVGLWEDAYKRYKEKRPLESEYDDMPF